MEVAFAFKSLLKDVTSHFCLLIQIQKTTTSDNLYVTHLIHWISINGIMERNTVCKVIFHTMNLWSKVTNGQQFAHQ